MLWQRPAAIALIWPLAWESPYAVDVTLKKKKKKKEEESKELRSVSTYEVVARIKSIPVGDCVLGPNSSAFCVLFM